MADSDTGKMNAAKVIDASGKLSGGKALEARIFAVKFRKEFMNEAMKEYLRKDFNASTKTKSEVRGGGRKPFRQKGTGNARQGSTRSPLRPGGGVTFGPKHRRKQNTLSRKKRQLALKHALSYLGSEGKIYYCQQPEFSKTKEAAAWLGGNFTKGKKVLLVTEKTGKKFMLPFRNIPGVSFSRASDLNIRKVIYSDAVVFMASGADSPIVSSFFAAGDNSQ